MSLRVLRLSTHVLPHQGGQQQHIQRLTSRLASAGVEHFLSYLVGGREVGPGVHLWPAPGAGVSARFPSHTARVLGMWAGVSRGLAYRLRRGFGVDVVHSHGDAAEAWVASRLARRAGAVSVHTIHGGLRSDGVYRLLAGYCFSRVDHLLAVSPAIATDLQAMGIPQKGVTVEPSGIETAAISRVPQSEIDDVAGRFGLSSESEVVLCVARLHPVKGQSVLIEAARLLAESRPGLRVVLVGDGPDRRVLAQQAAGMDQVVMTGDLQPGEVYALLGSSRLFVLPSVSLARQQEGQPTALMEAMAAGRPVVTTSSGGLKTLVTHEREGLVVPENDPRSLAEATQRILDDRSLATRLGRAGAKRVADRDWDAVADRVLALYDRLLSSKGVRTAAGRRP